jgi:hypothetical protein
MSTTDPTAVTLPTKTWIWCRILAVTLVALVAIGGVVTYEIHRSLDHMFDNTDFSGVHFTSGC